MQAIPDLYRQHASAIARLEALPAGASDDLTEVIDRELDALERRIEEMPSASAADFAAKAAIATARGRVCLDWETDPLWREARALLEEGCRVTPAACNAPTFRALLDTLQSVKAEHNARADDETPEGEARFARMLELDAQIAALPPQSVAAYAFKIVAADDGGDMNNNPEMIALAQEARRIVADYCGEGGEA